MNRKVDNSVIKEKQNKVERIIEDQRGEARNTSKNGGGGSHVGRDDGKGPVV